MMMRRSGVIQPIIDLFPGCRYLEVGVCEGETFFELKAAKKIAVDVHFAFDLEKAKAENPEATFFQMTSDAYFGKNLKSDEKFDVIFLDGLHVFEQTLRDLCNAIACLSENGVIVIDDVEPDSFAASLPDMNHTLAVNKRMGATSGWMGDVYKLVYFINSFFQMFSYHTVAENHGQVIMWRAPRPAEAITPRTIGEIAEMTFATVVVSPDSYQHASFAEIMQKLERK